MSLRHFDENHMHRLSAYKAILTTLFNLRSSMSEKKAEKSVDDIVLPCDTPELIDFCNDL